MSKLIIFASPIGNIEEISNFFIKRINELDLLFCEDTRVTKKLLNLLKIRRKIELISYHKFNENKKLHECIALIKSKKCGLISDAGYPTICDPGFLLINECYKNNIETEVVNGPSAIMHALTQCGFDTKNFIFLGFLERKENAIIEQINKALKNECPIVFFEAVHRINNTLKILKKMKLNNRIYIGRELSKKFETITRNNIKNISEQIEKGEFVVIIENFKNNKNELINDDLIKDYNKLIELGLKSKNACKFLAYKHNLKSNDLYNKLTKEK